MVRTRDVRARTVAAALLVLMLGGCSGGTEDSLGAAGGAAGGAADSAVTAPGAQGEAGGGTAPRAGSDHNALLRTSVQTRAVIRTGEVHLSTRELARSREAVEDVAIRHGGYVASEESVSDGRGRASYARLVLRLPAEDFDTAMRELSGLGRLQKSGRDSEDVTTEVIDVDTRVATQEVSLARLEGFLRRAADVDALIRLEAEIARRQADLESLKAQQAYLADQTALATITVHLSTRPTEVLPSDDTGFLAGLRSGWQALQQMLVVLATVAGVVLPFALSTAVVGVPLWLLTRALVRRRPASPQAPPAEEG